jgi:catechol 2,3-dioxygenase-like lactoylglutathione lyase family enzyme
VSAATTGHVGLNVSDVSRSIEFYCDVSGFEVLGQSAEPDQPPDALLRFLEDP